MATAATPRFSGTATNSTAKATEPCLDVITDTHNATYGTVTTPTPACFGGPIANVSFEIPVTVPFAGMMLPGTLFLTLEDVAAGATYQPSGTAANDKIATGMLRGFLTETSANNMGDTPSRLHIDFLGGVDLTLASFLAGGMANCNMDIDDKDMDANASDPSGWYFYLTFEAVKTTYTETP
jgi:hypothetical protein